MGIICSKYAHLGNVGNPDFNWDIYESGWNGKSLKVNKKVKTKDSKDKVKVYCHEDYAQDLYNKMAGIHVENVKDVRKGGTVGISDLNVINPDTIMATVGGGASTIMIDLNKEGRFFQQFSYDSEIMNKDSFVNAIQTNPEFKQQILSMELLAKVGTDTEKASIWDGYVEKMEIELKEQIKQGNKAYWAKILSTNNGGFVCEVAGTIRAFMPGSMAASNRIADYDSYIGKTMEVMVDSWTPKYGFVVSRKKYLNKVRPFKLQPIAETLKNAPETVYDGHVTGTTQFGVFVEIDEYITGMLHKTLVSDDLRDKMRQENANPGSVESLTPGTPVKVYVHKIENNRVILSDVAPVDRPAVMAKREAEDNAEKSEHIAQKNAEVAKLNAGNQGSETKRVDNA